MQIGPGQILAGLGGNLPLNSHLWLSRIAKILVRLQRKVKGIATGLEAELNSLTRDCNLYVFPLNIAVCNR